MGNMGKLTVNSSLVIILTISVVKNYKLRERNSKNIQVNIQ